MKILSVVGARPNFVKIAPLHRSFTRYPTVESKIVHTGQHFDPEMSAIFFDQLELPEPDYFMGVGQGSPIEQIAKVMLAFEQILHLEKPDLVLVVGDVNSTVACALVAAKLEIRIAHVEAGLRSGDRNMPEELNRIVTDQISDLLFITEQSAMDNLVRENVEAGKIHLVGNVMIDALICYQDKASRLTLTDQLGLQKGKFILSTLHRPSNVDNIENLGKLTTLLSKLARRMKVVFPVHPRTLSKLKEFGLYDELKNVENLVLLAPQGYLEFIHLMSNCGLVLTDSGGVQEETTYLGIPCFTLRSNTERPVTVEIGSNYLIPDINPDHICDLVDQIFGGKGKKCCVPEMWDGHAADRIAEILLKEKKAN